MTHYWCKHLLAISFAFILFTGLSVSRDAPSSAATNPAEAVIQADIAAQAAHDAASFLNLRSAKPEAPENRNDWANLRRKYPADDFIENILTARLIALKPVPLQVAAGLTHMAEYLQTYGDAQAYYVAIDYRLRKEIRAHYNGVNYRLYVLAPEEGQWVIVEASEAPVAQMVKAGLGFGTPEEQVALGIQSERVRTGQFTDPQGHVIDTLATGDHSQPNHIRIYRVDIGDIIEVDFYVYLTEVLPNEWISSWNAASLQAGAIAVKTYAWYRIYFPKYPGLYFDVKDSTADQVYRPGSARASTSAAVDAVQGVAFDSASGSLFEAQYWDGRGVAATGVDLMSAAGGGYVVAHANAEDELGVLSSGSEIANIGGTIWWLVKTGGVSNWTSYYAGWVPAYSLKSYWGSQPGINVFRGRMTQWGTRYFGGPLPNWSYDQIVHFFYDYIPHTSYSAARSFTYSPNRSPIAPTNINPPNGWTNASVTPALIASPFTDPDPGDYHIKTLWQVWKPDDFTVVWDSGWQPYGLTRISVPAGKLAYSTRYKWEVRYMDNHNAWTEPLPVATEFTTTFDPALMRYLYLPLLTR